MLWTDVTEIAVDLSEKHSDIDPRYILFTDLRDLVINLNRFNDDPNKSNEKILEAIQMLWIEELDEYKEKIIEISKLGKKVVFFLYNVGGYPFRHPYDFGIDIDDKMVEFFRDNGLEHLYLSFEGKEGYGVKEEDCEDDTKT